MTHSAPGVHIKAELLQCFLFMWNILFFSSFPKKATESYTFALQKVIFSLKSAWRSTRIFLRDSKTYILTHKWCFCQVHCNFIVVLFWYVIAEPPTHFLCTDCVPAQGPWELGIGSFRLIWQHRLEEASRGPESNLPFKRQSPMRSDQVAQLYSAGSWKLVRQRLHSCSEQPLPQHDYNHVEEVLHPVWTFFTSAYDHWLLRSHHTAQ